MTFILLHSGFGLNTNILSSNIINLAAVVAIVFSFVGQNLTNLLDERKLTIVNNLEEANQKALETQEKLNAARTQFESAKVKAHLLIEEGLGRAASELSNCVAEHQLRLIRLEEFSQDTLKFSQQKAVKQASTYVISRIMNRVRFRLSTGLEKTSHLIVNNFYVSLFTDKIS
jgi:F-type H+-transporting ATPase subunit b